MKTIFKYCAVAAFVVSTAHSAFAAETADLKVQGSLILGSCTPSLPEDGVVDYGKFSVNSLSNTDINQLGQKETTLTITCDSPTKVAWTIVDDRADTVVDTQPIINGKPAIVASEFGLGNTNATSGVGLGSYAVVVANNGQAVVDTATGSVTVSEDSGTTWATGSNGGIYGHPDGSRLLSFGDKDGNPIAFTSGSALLQIGTSIQDTTTLAITDDTPLDGQATISLKYL